MTQTPPASPRFRGAGLGVVVAAVVTLAAAGAARAETSRPCEPDKLAQRYPTLVGKTIRVGQDGVSPPFTFRDPKDPNHLVGSDADYASAVFACIGLPVEFVIGTWSGLVPAVAAGRIDVMWDALYYTPERAKMVDYVLYSTASDSALVAHGNPKHLSSLETLCGVTALGGVGTIETKMLAEQSDKCSAAGKPPLQIISYTDRPTAWQMIATGRADIVLTSTPLARSAAGDRPGSLELGFSFLTDIKVGVAVGKGRTELEQAIADGIAATQASGQIAKIFETYKMDPALILKPVILTQ